MTAPSAARISCASCAHRPSRSRRCRSSRPTTTWTTTRSRSRARPIARTPSSSQPSASCSPAHARRSTTSRTARRRAGPKASSATTARASTPGCWPRAGRTDGPFEGYRLPDHPLQRRIHELIGGGETAIDGCGLPTYAMALTDAARLLERVPARISEAMRALPGLIGGPGGADTELMRLRPGWLAKSGAEGLLCAVSPDGRGLALKVEDGAGRAVGPALGLLLGIEELASIEVKRQPRRGNRGRFGNFLTLLSLGGCDRNSTFGVFQTTARRGPLRHLDRMGRRGHGSGRPRYRRHRAAAGRRRRLAPRASRRSASSAPPRT